ncbi:hypothetical protein Hanom_Chr06g00577481 [Helianthus anomalus]
MRVALKSFRLIFGDRKMVNLLLEHVSAVTCMLCDSGQQKSNESLHETPSNATFSFVVLNTT